MTLVRDHPEGVHPLTKGADGHARIRLTAQGTHTAVVLVDKLDRATLRAIKYALTLGANDVFAIHAAISPANAGALAEVWMAQHLPIPLTLLECWDRNVARALEQDILRLSKDGNEVTVVMPRRDFPNLRQRMLHDRTSRRISKALGRYSHVDVAIVPYYFAPHRPVRTDMADASGRQVGSAAVRVIIMGCGRVGSELSLKLVEGGHDVTVIDKKPEAFIKYPPGDKATQMVGLGFDRDVLEAAGIKEAEAFVAVSSGDNSNIVSARVALEHYHVPKVVARIYDPRRAEIYEKLNIPTVATTTWGIKQIQLMLFHDRQEVRESIGGGDLVRLRVPVPAHLVGKKVSDVNVEGKILVAGVSRGGGGFIPTPDSTFQTGDYLAVIMAKDGMDLLDEIMVPPAGEHH